MKILDLVVIICSGLLGGICVLHFGLKWQLWLVAGIYMVGCSCAYVSGFYRGFK
jgi:hypothetical protein